MVKRMASEACSSVCYSPWNRLSVDIFFKVEERTRKDAEEVRSRNMKKEAIYRDIYIHIYIGVEEGNLFI